MTLCILKSVFYIIRWGSKNCFIWDHDYFFLQDFKD